MSSKDDPFGTGGKTVIRPNPGGVLRPDQFRPMPMPGGAKPAPSGERTVITPMPPPPVPPQPAPAAAPRPGGVFPQADTYGQQGAGFGAPPPPPRPSHGLPSSTPEAWMIGGDAKNNFYLGDRPQQAPQPDRKIPLEVALNARDAGRYSAANPITSAAAPLLILLGRLRLLIVEMQAVPLMNHVADSIIDFERKVLEAGVPREDAQIAKYALCGTADDIVQNLPGTDRHVWMQYSMLARFFQVRTSGVGFFDELNKILANPAPRYHLLELMHACLSLGFEGQYRGSAGGDNELQRIRRDVYQTLRHLQARPDDDISPRWRGMAMMMRNMSTRIPLWAIAGGLALLLVGVYLLLRFLIANDGDAVSRNLVALHPNDTLTIARSEVAVTPYVPPPAGPSTQLQRIRDGLADQIEAGAMDVVMVGEMIVMRVDNLVLFATGRADVKPEFVPVAQRIAAALESEPGPINVIGHTDNVPMSGRGAFKSNFDLSVARANSVAKVLSETISDPARIIVEGKGEDEPIADNSTPEGRQTNRRVEIKIPREETLAQ